MQTGFAAHIDLLAAAGLLPARLEPRGSLTIAGVLTIQSRAVNSPGAPSRLQLGNPQMRT